MTSNPMDRPPISNIYHGAKTTDLETKKSYKFLRKFLHWVNKRYDRNTVGRVFIVFVHNFRSISYIWSELCARLLNISRRLGQMNIKDDVFNDDLKKKDMNNIEISIAL